MRSFRAAALALALTLALSAAPADAADGDGTLDVTIVDHAGRPQPANLSVIGAAGPVGSSQVGSSTATFELPPGDYGVVSLTAWGGFACAGLSKCDYLSVVTGATAPDGSVTVSAGKVSAVTITTPEPAVVAGTGRVGAPLTLDFSKTLEELYVILGGAGGFGLRPDVQWLRNGTPIEGATAPEYTPVADDADQRLSARLSYGGTAAAVLQQYIGAPTGTVTTAARKITRIPTRTFVRLFRGTISAGQQGVARIDATADGTIVTGRATLAVGDWKVTRTLRNGSTRLRLPKLAPGTYVVVARYLGGGSFEASTAKRRTLTVTRG